MASKRMFNIELMTADEFIALSIQSQQLYIRFALEADDDGFVRSAASLQRLLGCGENEVSELERAGYIIVFNSGKIVIRHWLVHNYIRKDIYVPTKCVKEKAQLKLNKSKIYYLKNDSIEEENYGDVDIDESLTQVREEQVNKGQDQGKKKHKNSCPKSGAEEIMEALDDKGI